MPVYRVRDTKTGNIFRINQEYTPTKTDFLKAKRAETLRAYQDIVESDGYRKQGMYDTVSVPTNVAQKNLQRGLGLLLNTNINNVNVSDSELGIFDRLGLSFRANADEKLQALIEEFKTETNPNPVKIVSINKQPRFLLEQRDDENNPLYSLIDEEGFSVGDIADLSREVLPTIASVGASILLAPKTGGTSLAIGYGAIAKMAAGGGIAYGATKQAQDMSIKAWDDLIKQNDFQVNEYLGYSGRQAVQNIKESVVVGLVDAATMKSLGIVSSRFGKGGANSASKQLLDAQGRLLSRYAQGSDIKILAPAASGGIRSAKREADAVLSSKLIQNTYGRNANAVNDILNTMKTGDPSLINEAIQNAANTLNRAKEAAKSVISNAENKLHRAIDQSYQDLAARSGVNGYFNGNTIFEPIRKNYLRNERIAKQAKNAAYRLFDREATKAGIKFDGSDIIIRMKQTLARYKGSPNVHFSDDFVAILNSTVKTNLRNIDELTDAVIRSKKGVNINTRQLQKMIEAFDRKAGRGLPSNKKSPDQILSEMMSNTLRQARDRRLIKNGKGINPAGKALVQANRIYNDTYLPYLRVAKGNIQAQKVGSSAANRQYQYQGNYILDDILSSGDDMITDFLSRFNSGVDRELALDALRKRFLQRNGMDGTIKIGAGNKIRFDTERLRALYGERTATGKLIRSQKNEALIKSQAAAFERLNKIAGGKLVDLDEAALNTILLGADPKTIKKATDRLAEVVRLKTEYADVLQNNLLELTKKGELVHTPSAYVDALLTTKKTDDLKKIMQIIDELPEELQDTIQTSYIENLLRLAKPEGGNAITRTLTDVPVADGNELLKKLKAGTTTGDNSRIILGNDVVQDLEAAARILRYSFDPKGVAPLELGRGVLTTNGVTWVATHITEPLGRKMFGVAATQGWLRPILTKSTTEEMIYRQKSLLPWVLPTEKTLHNFGAEFYTNPNTARDYGLEMLHIYENMERTDQEPMQ